MGFGNVWILKETKIIWKNFLKKENFLKRKILITGGTGFIGYHLAKKCVRMGWEVTSFSKKKPKSIRTLKKVNYLFGDLTKKKTLKF